MERQRGKMRKHHPRVGMVTPQSLLQSHLVFVGTHAHTLGVFQASRPSAQTVLLATQDPTAFTTISLVDPSTGNILKPVSLSISYEPKALYRKRT